MTLGVHPVLTADEERALVEAWEVLIDATDALPDHVHEDEDGDTYYCRGCDLTDAAIERARLTVKPILDRGRLRALRG